jgi:hypothetical protein
MIELQLPLIYFIKLYEKLERTCWKNALCRIKNVDIKREPEGKRKILVSQY